jgi:hypothetical protein
MAIFKRQYARPHASELFPASTDLATTSTTGSRNVARFDDGFLQSHQ